MVETPTQQCGSCKQQLPHSAFSPSYVGKRGSWCKKCFSAYQRGERTKTSHPARPCVICGTEYVPKQIKATELGTCSPSCKAKARRRRMRERGGLSEIDRLQNIKRLYGARAAEWYAATFESQGGVCAVCLHPPPEGEYLHIDHDHSCCPGRSCGKCLRGLACNNCNRFMGLARDDPDLLLAAARYLKKWKSERTPA